MEAIIDASRTKLETVLFELHLNDTEAARKVDMAPKTLNDKLRHRTKFNLPEMRKIQQTFAPDMSLEELFEGY